MRCWLLCVNSITMDDARHRTGPVPDTVEWRTDGDTPGFLLSRIDESMAEEVAWKLAPLRFFPDRYELSLDNDCILWELSEAISALLDEREPRCLIAADVKLAHGAFTELTRPEPRNTGIRGLPPHYDFGAALLTILKRHPVPLRSELDEQGLQIVALDLERPAHVVSAEEVTICSPFWPHQPRLGWAGAHFGGLNCYELPCRYYDRPAIECIEENWRRHRPELYSRVGLPVA